MTDLVTDKSVTKQKTGFLTCHKLETDLVTDLEADLVTELSVTN